MSIYAKHKEVLPYVYICVEKKTGNFYIGYRYKNKVSAEEDFGTYYFTSNAYVKSNFSNFEFKIICEFKDKKSAFEYETKLINETKCEKQINSFKHKNKKKKKKSKINLYCMLPGCGKYINSSIKKFCCRRHCSSYGNLKKNNKLS